MPVGREQAGARRVLVTRPAARAAEDAAALRAQGLDAVIAPLTRIEHSSPPPEVPARAEALIFTSAEAVAAMAGDPRARALPTHCVGPQTRAAAAAAGFTCVGEPAGDVEALGQALLAAPETRFFHPAGEHVAGDLGGALSAAGKSVERRTAYAALAIPLSPAVVAILEAGDFVAAGFWSPRNATLFADAAQAAAGQGRPWRLSGTVGVAMSRNVGEALRDLGFARIRLPERPEGTAMREALIDAARRP